MMLSCVWWALEQKKLPLFNFSTWYLLSRNIYIYKISSHNINLFFWYLQDNTRDHYYDRINLFTAFKKFIPQIQSFKEYFLGLLFSSRYHRYTWRCVTASSLSALILSLLLSPLDTPPLRVHHFSMFVLQVHQVKSQQKIF